MDDKLKYIGWYQLLGGVLGFGLTIWLIIKTDLMSGLTVLIMLLALGLYVYSVYCGTLLIKNKRNGIKLTIINQILQIFYVSLFGVTYQYYSGVHLSFGIDYTTDFLLKFDFSLSGFDLSYDPKGENVIVMINIVPIILIGFLEKLKIKNDDKEILDTAIEKIKSTGG